MVIFSSFMNAIGTIPYSVVFVVENAIYEQDKKGIIYNFSIMILHLLLGLDIFVYYFFNVNYREVFNCYLKKIFSFLK